MIAASWRDWGICKFKFLKYKISAKGIKYIRAEVRKPDRTMQALTNPVWIAK
jgi:hypothetical protein